MKTTKSPSSARLEPRCILVPVDFSESSLTALRHAQSLARCHEARIVLLHVIEPFHADLHMDTAQIQREAGTAARERLDHLAEAAKRAWPRTSRAVRAGHPVPAITAHAKRVGADLIVMGTHGRTGLKRALIGSVAERVVRMAPCSVLVVR